MTKTRKFAIPALVLALVLVFLLANGSVFASARDATWTTSVTYQNVGTGAATLMVTFYEENDPTPITFDPLGGGTLGAGAARSFWIGNVSNVPSGFRGNAVMSADQPLVSTAVQFSQDPGFKMRLLYNGFQTSDASSQYLVATTLLRKFDRTTVFSIQNTENEAIDATVKFYDADNNGNLAATITHAIPANSSKFVEMDNPADTGLPGTTTIFNGSAIVTAVKQAGGDAMIVAAANEYYTNSNVAASFEGVPLSRTANTVYVATGVCEKFGLDTFYAVSNAGTTGNASITVDYTDKDGNPKASDGPYTIGPGQKKSIRTCNPSDGTNMSGFTGSAEVTSVGNAVVVVAKAQNSINAGTGDTADVFTAFLGEPAGQSKQAIPFVRWANNSDYAASTGQKQRSYIAIQNLEATSKSFDAKYYDKNGNLVATQTLSIPGGSKGNTNASLAGALGATGMLADSFGYYTDGTAGGAMIIEAAAANPTATFIAINRTQNPGAGEDANAVPAP